MNLNENEKGLLIRPVSLGVCLYIKAMSEYEWAFHPSGDAVVQVRPTWAIIKLGQTYFALFSHC